ncbi:MAG: STAS-like domain-containing protein [Candidatus Heimdallarchaeota archaeon]
MARDIRLKKIIHALENKQEITLDFDGIDSTTQSFIHALISDLIRKYGIDVLDKIYFKNCNEIVTKIINIVVDYMQEIE